VVAYFTILAVGRHSVQLLAVGWDSQMGPPSWLSSKSVNQC